MFDRFQFELTSMKTEPGRVYSEGRVNTGGELGPPGFSLHPYSVADPGFGQGGQLVGGAQL